MSGRPALAVDRLDSPDVEVAARLQALLQPDFLQLLDWRDDVRVLHLPQDHPVLGWVVCGVPNCEKAQRSGSTLCAGCRVQHERSGLLLEEFLSLPLRRQRAIGISSCSVPGCERPWRGAAERLCSAHHYQQKVVYNLPLAVFIQHPSAVPLPPFGPCLVLSCSRGKIDSGSYCAAHRLRWKNEVNRSTKRTEEQWRIIAPPIAVLGEISLRGLRDRVVAEILYALQERTNAGTVTRQHTLRVLCNRLRKEQCASIEDLADNVNDGALSFRNILAKSVRRAFISPETERTKLTWDLSAFGLSGYLKFTDISQPWLLEATQSWVANDLPKRRGDGARSAVQGKVAAVGRLSESLRLQPDDQGNNIRDVGARDIDNFCNRLAFLASQGQISDNHRITICRNIYTVLRRMRSSGQTRPGGPLAGLPDDFVMLNEHIPDSPEDSQEGRDLPVEVMRMVCDHLPSLEELFGRETRIAVELMIDTGRRPEEICKLPWDCLERDQSNKSVLVYDNGKANRLARRLPIGEATARLIVEQKIRARAAFPDASLGKLVLFPSPKSNPYGEKSITDKSISERHRTWISSLPELVLSTDMVVNGQPATVMSPFDKMRIFPYAYRHSYAQRHADAGIAVDVLRTLMDHRQLHTTQLYYRVGEERRREAVDRLTALQFDRSGNRVWHEVKNLLDHEHARRSAGQVAVPYGECSEPSNVAAGGNDCPVRFRCVGCGHFSTDASYLPDLEAYLGDLLRNRERLLALTNADDWAKIEAAPSDEEIRRIRRLIERMKAEMDNLTAGERAQIDQAVAVVRRGRVMLPVSIRVRQPLPDLRPGRIA